MLDAWAHLLAYGLVLIASLFLIVIWTDLAVLWRASPEASVKDKKLVLALLLIAVAASLLFGSRTVDSFYGFTWVPPISGTIAGAMVLVGCLLLFSGKALLIQLSDRARRWKLFPVFIGVSVAYAVGCWAAISSGLIRVAT